MLASRLISDFIPPLKLADTCGRAMTWMDELRVNVLPVLEGKNYLGLASKDQIADPKLSGLSLAQAALSLDRVFVYENQHVYDLVKMAATHRLDLVPVLSNDEEYIGLVTVNDLVQYFAETKSVYTPGGIIILEIALKDYTMSQIAQLVESDGAHILSASVSPVSEGVIELTLKIDKVDLTRILAAFYRFDYNITGSYHQNEHSDDLKNRFDALMNYLSIG